MNPKQERYKEIRLDTTMQNTIDREEFESSQREKADGLLRDTK